MGRSGRAVCCLFTSEPCCSFKDATKSSSEPSTDMAARTRAGNTGAFAQKAAFSEAHFFDTLESVWCDRVVAGREGEPGLAVCMCCDAGRQDGTRGRFALTQLWDKELGGAGNCAAAGGTHPHQDRWRAVKCYPRVPQSRQDYCLDRSPLAARQGEVYAIGCRTAISATMMSSQAPPLACSGLPAHWKALAAGTQVP